MSVLRNARDIMRRELRRYDVPEGTHVDIEMPPADVLEADADAIELRMTRLGPGFGMNAPYEFTVIRLPGQILRDNESLARALVDEVHGACKRLFGPHDGEGLP